MGDVTIRSSRDASGVMHRRELDSAGIRTVIDKIGMFEFRNGALSVIHHDNGYITLDRPVPEELFLTGTVSHVKTEKAVKITTERVLNSPANEENKAQECIEMIAGFEVKNGAQYLADIEEFAVQGLNYIFVIRDHLGSPRVLFEDANNDGGIDFANEVMEFKLIIPLGSSMRTSRPVCRNTVRALMTRRRSATPIIWNLKRVITLKVLLFLMGRIRLVRAFLMQRR